MKLRKTVAALSVVVGLCVCTIPCGDINSSSIETGAIVGESQSVLSDSQDAFLQKIANMPEVDVMKVLANPHSYPTDSCIKAAYEYLTAKNIDLEDIKTTLDYIIIYNNHPMGLTEKEYAYVLGILGKDLPENINGFSAFYPLALAYHELDCPYPHNNNSCTALDSLWAEVGPISGEEMMDLAFGDYYAYQKIKLAMRFNPVLSMNDYISELISLSMISLDDSISEEALHTSYPALSEALGAGEYMLDTFYDLAKLTRELFFPEDNMASSRANFNRNISK